MPRPVQTPAQLAATAARLCKAGQCDSRAFDDCFEMGNGEQVVAEFVKLHDRDRELQRAAWLNEHYINLARWRLTAERVAAPLFAQA